MIEENKEATNLITKRTYTYDENGNSIEQILEDSEGDFTKFLSEYDEFNNLTIQNWFDKDGIQKHKTSFKYVYDAYGNWITMERYLNDKIDFIWERKIEYY